MKRYKMPLVLSLGLLMSCASNVHYDASKAHHTRTGFKNIYDQSDKGLWDVLKWRWSRSSDEIPGVDDYDFPLIKTDHQWLQSNTDKASLTWIGHATFLLQFKGLNILTDPQFSERASPVTWAGPRRVVPPALQIDQLPEIDAVVISHDHYDSLDVATVRALSRHNRERRLAFIVPLGMKAWLEDLELESVDIVELDWTQGHQINRVSFIAEPSQHWCKRSLFDTNQRLWASFVIQSGEDRIFFAGDTGYARHFQQIGDKYGEFDLALLPIGAYEPRWFMKENHVNPQESVQIHQDIHSKYSVAMHWGTFILTDEPLDEPPVKLAEALKQSQLPASSFEVYQHGETRFIDHLF